MRWLLCVGALLVQSGCVDPFGGSSIQAYFFGGVHVPGDPQGFGRPPAGTHYSFLALNHDADGNGFVFALESFDVRTVIDTSSPCFIEDDESRFPGLHVTRYAERLRVDIGVDDPFGDGVREQDAIDLLTADRRMSNLGLLRSSIKAVTSHSPAPYPPVAADCDGGDTEIPPPECTDDSSNARRLRLCEQFWADNPLLYEGSDKVFTLPLAGVWHGSVDGTDPRTGQPIGGANFLVDADLTGIDSLLVNWQYNCGAADFAALGADCAPVYPDDFPVEDQSPIGYHYMAGRLEEQTRGVQSTTMSNTTFSQISGHVSVFADLDEDDNHF